MGVLGDLWVSVSQIYVTPESLQVEHDLILREREEREGSGSAPTHRHGNKPAQGGAQWASAYRVPEELYRLPPQSPEPHLWPKIKEREAKRRAREQAEEMARKREERQKHMEGGGFLPLVPFFGFLFLLVVLC